MNQEQIIDGDLTNQDNSYTFNNETYYYDFYSIDDVVDGLEPGDLVDINVDADGFDPLLFVLDSRGNVIDVSEDGDLTFVVGSGEPFFLSVESQAANDTGSYTLDVDILDNSVSYVDANGNPVREEILGADETIVGVDSIRTADTIQDSLASGDLQSEVTEVNSTGVYLFDQYSLTGATVDQQIRVDIDANFDSELSLSVFNSDLELIANESLLAISNNLNGNVGSDRIEFTVKEGFDYFIGVSSFEPGAIGDYTLTTEVI